MVWKLDGLSRLLRNVLTIMEASSGENSRLSQPYGGRWTRRRRQAGRMMIQMVGAFAEFEHASLKERTHAGLDGNPPSAGAYFFRQN